MAWAMFLCHHPYTDSLLHMYIACMHALFIALARVWCSRERLQGSACVDKQECPAHVKCAPLPVCRFSPPPPCMRCAAPGHRGNDLTEREREREEPYKLNRPTLSQPRAIPHNWV
eukprot:366490-Chlamydomonas_euryale.AAC.42